MYKFLLIFILLIGQSLFSQENYTFASDNVRIVYSIQEEDDYFLEEIKVENLSSDPIYMPKQYNEEHFFFTAGDRLYSYLGIMNSILGAPGLGGQVELIKINSKDIYVVDIEIKKEKPIKYYSFGFDFISHEDKRFIEKRDGKLWIDTTDYVDVDKGFYHKQQ